MRDLRAAGVGRVSVSLNVYDERVKMEGLETEITAVTIPEVDVGRVREMAERMGVGSSGSSFYSFITRTLQWAFETTPLETLPNRKATALPKPLLPTTIRSKFSCSAVFTNALEGLEPRIDDRL